MEAEQTYEYYDLCAMCGSFWLDRDDRQPCCYMPERDKRNRMVVVRNAQGKIIDQYDEAIA